MKKNDKKAHILIWVFTAIVLLAVTVLDRITLPVNLPFDKHIFALLSAIVNTLVSLLLVAGFVTIKMGKMDIHKKIMLSAMALSVLFLVFYILHHLFTGETHYGDVNHDGELSKLETTVAGFGRYVYYFIISSHILLAAVTMPLVLYSAYRALIGEYYMHKQLVRMTFPLWLYVAVTGVVVYLMISPYYQHY
jgi:putative membrane protein